MTRPPSRPGEPACSECHRLSRSMPLASRISLGVRKRMFAEFLRRVAPGPATRVLDLGVTCDDALEANFFEALYPYPANVTCAGVEDASHLERRFPGVRFVRIEPGRPLPFADREFDAVFSNAVVEHTGGTAGQRVFVREAVRVARAFFITTPNRWFPVDLHTGLPLAHWLPRRAHRAILRALGYGFYSKEENLNLLSAGELRALFPDPAAVSVQRVRLLGFASNLIAAGVTLPTASPSAPGR